MNELANQLLTVAEAAEVLKVTPDRAYSLIRAGLLPAVRLGPKQIRVARRALERFIESGGRTDV